jgi:hypothetical protein
MMMWHRHVMLSWQLMMTRHCRLTHVMLSWQQLLSWQLTMTWHCPQHMTLSWQLLLSWHTRHACGRMSAWQQQQMQLRRGRQQR